MLFDIIMVSPARGTIKSIMRPVNKAFTGLFVLWVAGRVAGKIDFGQFYWEKYFTTLS